MPMIDVYATAGTFADKHKLAADLAGALMTIEEVPNIPMFRQNTAGFVHDLPPGDLSNVDGESNYVRVQVLTNADALDRDKQIKVVSQFTALVAEAAGDPTLHRPHVGAPHPGGAWRLGPWWSRQYQRRTGHGRPRARSRNSRRVKRRRRAPARLRTGPFTPAIGRSRRIPSF